MQRCNWPGRVLPATCLLATILWVACGAGMLRAAPPGVTPPPMAEVLPPTISADEPRAAHFSARRAAEYLDAAALQWQTTRKCAACHTMVPYVMARPALAKVVPEPSDARRFFEEVAAGTRDAMPDYQCGDIDGAVAINTAAALALNDRATTGKLHPLTRKALDRMWTLQKPDGTWTWPFRDTPPLKVRPHYGVTLAALAAGGAPGDYAETPAARVGLGRIRSYLRATPPLSLHEEAMLVWASTRVEGLLERAKREEIVRRLLAAQRPDGGWSMASLIDNTGDPSLPAEKLASARGEAGYGRSFLAYVGADKTYHSSLDSDGYGTGFAVFIARQAGISRRDERLQRGIAWLQSNQRESGRWFTPSQSWHSENRITNAGTAFAALALQACDALLPTQPRK